MKIKIFNLGTGFLSSRDSSINIFCPFKNKCVEYFLNNKMEDKNSFIFEYTNTFNIPIYFYAENLNSIEVIHESNGDYYIEADFSKGKQIDKKEFQHIKRKTIINNLLS
jgi:hypothetical protein